MWQRQLMRLSQRLWLLAWSIVPVATAGQEPAPRTQQEDARIEVESVMDFREGATPGAPPGHFPILGLRLQDSYDNVLRNRKEMEGRIVGAIADSSWLAPSAIKVLDINPDPLVVSIMVLPSSCSVAVESTEVTSIPSDCQQELLFLRFHWVDLVTRLDSLLHKRLGKADPFFPPFLNAEECRRHQIACPWLKGLNNFLSGTENSDQGRALATRSDSQPQLQSATYATDTATVTSTDTQCQTTPCSTANSWTSENLKWWLLSFALFLGAAPAGVCFCFCFLRAAFAFVDCYRWMTAKQKARAMRASFMKKKVGQEAFKLDEGWLCAICLGDNGEGTDLLQLPCQHILHCDCMEGWLARKCSCPLCRQAFEAGTCTVFTITSGVSNIKGPEEQPITAVRVIPVQPATRQREEMTSVVVIAPNLPNMVPDEDTAAVVLGRQLQDLELVDV